MSSGSAKHQHLTKTTGYPSPVGEIRGKIQDCEAVSMLVLADFVKTEYFKQDNINLFDIYDHDVYGTPPSKQRFFFSAPPQKSSKMLFFLSLFHILLIHYIKALEEINFPFLGTI